MAQVSASIVKPYDDSPFEGIFTITTEFSPMAATSFEPARVGPYELLLSRTLDNTLRRARALDLESLCIVAKKLVWSIRVDVHFLDHDGGLVDAACVAVVAALSAFRREDVDVRGEEVRVVTIPLRQYPFCLGYGTMLTLVSGDGASAGEIGDITYPSHDDVLLFFAAGSVGRKGNDNSGEYLARRACHNPRCNICRGTVAKWELHR